MNKVLKKIITSIMCATMALTSIPYMKPTTAKAWWWNNDKEVIIWQKWVNGSVSSFYGPELTYHIMFMDTDFDEYWIGENIRWSELTPYFNPGNTGTNTTVTVKKSFINNSDRFLHVC